MAVQSPHAAAEEIPPPASLPDTGAAVHRKPIDLVRLAHEMGRPGHPLTTAELVLGARRNGFRARAVRSRPERLAGLPLPAIARGRDGRSFVLARRQGERTLIQRPGEVPTVWSAAALAEAWSGELIRGLPVHPLRHRPGSVCLVNREATGAGPAGAARGHPPSECQAGTGPDESSRYWVTVQLDRSTVKVDGHAVPLRSGMAAQVDIATGMRRVIAFLLDLVKQQQMEAGHERQQRKYNSPIFCQLTVFQINGRVN